MNDKLEKKYRYRLKKDYLPIIKTTGISSISECYLNYDRNAKNTKLKNDLDLCNGKYKARFTDDEAWGLAKTLDIDLSYFDKIEGKADNEIDFPLQLIDNKELLKSIKIDYQNLENCVRYSSGLDLIALTLKEAMTLIDDSLFYDDFKMDFYFIVADKLDINPYNYIIQNLLFDDYLEENEKNSIESYIDYERFKKLSVNELDYISETFLEKNILDYIDTSSLLDDIYKAAEKQKIFSSIYERC